MPRFKYEHLGIVGPVKKHPIYRAWINMNDRCRNKNHRAWANYGGRGISVCKSWRNSFDAFWHDTHQSWEPGLTLDRIDNDLGYFKENCRWIGSSDQALNRRSTVHVNGFRSIAEFSNINGLAPSTVGWRLKKGVAEERLSAPPNISPPKSITIIGQKYGSLKHARRQTGLSNHILNKYSNAGIFEHEKYRASCVAKGKIPKV